VKPEDEVMIITDRGQTIRTPVEGIRETGRNTQGVKLMSIADDERVVAIEPIGESAATGLDDETLGDSETPPAADAEGSAETEEPSAGAAETEGGDGGEES
jgi:DNA gyrase subunit A